MPNTGLMDNLIYRTELTNRSISEMNPESLGPDASERKKRTKTKIIMHIYNYLKDIYSKILRYRNDVKCLEAHLRTKTAPESLYYTKFPEPLIKHDARYVDLHNKIIVETQIRIMVETIQYINAAIKKLDEEAVILKRSLSHFVNDVDERVKTIYEKEMEKIASETVELMKMDTSKPEFNMSFYRAYRFVSKPFMAEKIYNTPKRVSTATLNKIDRETRGKLHLKNPLNTTSRSISNRPAASAMPVVGGQLRSRSKSKMRRRNSRSSNFSESRYY